MTIDPNWSAPIELKPGRYVARVWQLVGRREDVHVLASLFKNDEGRWEYRHRVRQDGEKTAHVSVLAAGVTEELAILECAAWLGELARKFDCFGEELPIETDDHRRAQMLLDASGWFTRPRLVHQAKGMH